jgi:UDP-N-acetylglucosamine diphosphorylase/glucosamine-1-phosphate N-acetyltransferase
MHIVLSDCDAQLRFAPLTLTRPIAELRTGIYTNRERWEKLAPECSFSYETADYLQRMYPLAEEKSPTWVNAGVIISEKLVAEIKQLAPDHALFCENHFIAFRGAKRKKRYVKNIIQSKEKAIIISERWHLYQKNAEILALDFLLATNGRKSAGLSKTNQLIGDKNQLFIEPNAKVEGAILNTNDGPIYIGSGAEIMEGSVIRGGLALCEHSTLKLSSKIYGATTIGPYCKVGGEVNNSIFQAFSNKGHDGFLGNSLIGEWCNLGADTNTSNLKSNYGKVKTYSYITKKLEQTDELFMGLAMGDHSKTSINTMLNTATVVGVSSMIFGNGFPPKYIPSFSWGGFDNERFDFGKAIVMANSMMVRRGKEIVENELQMLKYLHNSKGV